MLRQRAALLTVLQGEGCAVESRSECGAEGLDQVCCKELERGCPPIHSPIQPLPGALFCSVLAEDTQKPLPQPAPTGGAPHSTLSFRYKSNSQVTCPSATRPLSRKVVWTFLPNFFGEGGTSR